jgi:YHS domain-containing protein
MEPMLWRLLGALGVLALGLGSLVTRSRDRRQRPVTGVDDELVPDPQCGVYIPRSQAVMRTIDGKAHHFCSRECARAFAGRKEH